jgi:hypothetical protein
MLIEEGERFQDTPREELPEVPPPEERRPLSVATAMPASIDDRQKLIIALVGALVGVGLVMGLVIWLRRKQECSSGLCRKAPEG